MKKFLVVICSCLLFFSTNNYAFSPIKVKFVPKSIGILTPDNELIKYKDAEDVPEILYSSTIIAYGMTILSFYDIDFVLKNNQAIFISKDPITKDIIISKIENSRTGNINITFDAGTMGEMTPDTKIALRYLNSQIILKVLTGSIYMQSDGTEFELITGEIYTYKITKKETENDNAF